MLSIGTKIGDLELAHLGEPILFANFAFLHIYVQWLSCQSVNYRRLASQKS